MAGGIAALAAVACGAFGAHALKQIVSPERLSIWQTGVAYHFYHALGLLVVGLVSAHMGQSKSLSWAGWLMIAGLLLFSGSLYLLVLSDLRVLGMITPIGGVAWLIAWGLFVAAIRNARPLSSR